MANPDPEVRSRRMVKCHIVYPSVRPDLQIRIGNCCKCNSIQRFSS